MTENNQNYLTKVDLAEFTEEVLLPAFEKMLDDKLDPIKQEIHSIRLELEEIKTDLKRIDKRTDEDSSTAFAEIDKLKRKVLELENKVKVLETQRA
jgi:Skp family chaperone for outer membrane proteins